MPSGRLKRTDSEEEGPRGGPSSRSAAGDGALVAAVLLFAALHAAAALWLPESVWGAHHLRFVPPPARVAWAALLALVLLPRTRSLLGTAIEKASGFSDRAGPRRAALAFLICSLFLAVFRSRNLFLGDGYLLSGILASGDDYEPGHAGYGTFLVCRGLFHLLRWAGWEVGGDVPFALLAVLSGLLVLWAARGIARELAGAGLSRAVAAGAVLFSGTALLFFGYVELYGPMHAFVLFYLYLGVRFVRGRSGIAAPTAALAAAAALHLTALVLLPSWLFLVLSGPRLKRGTRIACIAGLAGAAIPVAWYLFSTAGTYRKVTNVMSLATRGGAAHALLFPEHLGLLGNVLLLGLGGALLLLVPRREGPGGPNRAAAPTHARRFLGVASACSLLFMFIVDPKLGSRDWDLLALPVFPLVLLLVSGAPVLRRTVSPSRAALLLGAMVLHTAPWIAANMDRDRGVAMTLAMVARDPHYDDPALRASSSLTLLLNEAGYPAEAARIARRAVEARGGAVDFCNLGKALGAQGDYKEAIRWFRRAVEADPRLADARFNLAVAHRLKGDPAEAERTLREWLALAPGDGAALRLLGAIVGERGGAEETIAIFERCVAVDSGDGEAWERLAILYARAGRGDDARAAASRALRLRPQASGARAVLEELGGGSGPAAP